jgi:molybdopterin converting factor small subunit
MKVAVQLFGPLAEQAGRTRLEVTVTGSTVRDVVAATGLKLDPSIRFALNTDYVGGEATIKEGDVVSLIPPVGGG